MRSMNSCPFCRMFDTGSAQTTVHHWWEDAVAIEPLAPVVDGHLLIIPRRHVRDYIDDPVTTAQVMRHAAEIGPFPSNLITSAGVLATQSVFHLHVHIVPRREDDGLALPWTGQTRA